MTLVMDIVLLYKVGRWIKNTERDIWGPVWFMVGFFAALASVPFIYFFLCVCFYLRDTVFLVLFFFFLLFFFQRICRQGFCFVFD